MGKREKELSRFFNICSGHVGGILCLRVLCFKSFCSFEDRLTVRFSIKLRKGNSKLQHAVTDRWQYEGTLAVKAFSLVGLKSI
jgi:hypothetical protein